MKIVSIFAALASGLALGACTNQPDYRPIKTDPPVVSAVDLEKYAGLWYEIARYPNSFETGCEGVTAEYRQRDDGKITVLNTCREGSPTGKARASEGVARIVSGSNNAKLKVKFAPEWVPFASGDYWILHLEPDYSAALVGAPSGKYLWILARSSQLAPEKLDKIKARAEALGYETEPLRMTAHAPQD